MSVKSERVKVWRKNFKQRIIEAMGGKCCICGYTKCANALALHHIDPAKKEFGIGSVKANPLKWELVVAELRKCILLCHNCHSELHAGLIDKIVSPSFNEEFATYYTKNSKENKEKLLAKSKQEKSCDPCPTCQSLKPIYQKYCSYKCSSKAHYRVDWDNINLEEELKTQSVVQLSEKLGCSDAAVHKRLRKMGFDKTKLLHQNGMNRRSCSTNSNLPSVDLLPPKQNSLI